MPSGLRPSLYMKDDDYIESFTHGNFITLTNTSTADIEKIIRFELMPLNISLHSFNRKVRDLLFGNKRNHSGVDNLFHYRRGTYESYTFNIRVLQHAAYHGPPPMHHVPHTWGKTRLLNQFGDLGLTEGDFA